MKTISESLVRANEDPPSILIWLKVDDVEEIHLYPDTSLFLGHNTWDTVILKGGRIEVWRRLVSIDRDKDGPIFKLEPFNVWCATEDAWNDALSKRSGLEKEYWDEEISRWGL